MEGERGHRPKNCSLAQGKELVFQGPESEFVYEGSQLLDNGEKEPLPLYLAVAWKEDGPKGLASPQDSHEKAQGKHLYLSMATLLCF